MKSLQESHTAKTRLRLSKKHQKYFWLKKGKSVIAESTFPRKIQTPKAIAALAPKIDYIVNSKSCTYFQISP